MGLLRSLEWQYLPPEEIPHVEALVLLGGGTHPAEDPRALVEVNSAGANPTPIGGLDWTGLDRFAGLDIIGHHTRC